MIEELRITDLGVIESSTLPLGPGLTVLTGETGAGKTMVVTALGLLMGGRADTSVVRGGAKRARVEGLLAASGALADRVEDSGGEVEDGTVLLARTVATEGRSRAYLGGAAVPVSVLGEATEDQLTVHGQSDQHRLLRPDRQRASLDLFAGAELAELLASYAEAHARLLSTERELADLTGRARERAREADLLRFGIDEIAQVAPQPGEDAALAAEEGRLGHADTLRTAAVAAREALSSERDAGSGVTDALGAVASARALLDGVRDHDADAAALADRLGELTYLLSDLAADVASYAHDVDSDPARLAAVSQRRAALTALQRKYGDSADAVLAWAAESAARLASLEDSDGRVERLAREREDLRDRLGRLAGDLSRARTTAATDLARAITEEVRALAMPHAALDVAVTQRDAGADGLEVDGRRLAFSATGVDDVEFRLAANPGAPARPLSKAASGGELSRVMLALEVVLAGAEQVPTFVFDEVDAGVGGRAATEVGARLARLATRAQVLVVTHLPQVAAFADSHVLIQKASDGLITTSGLTVLTESERVRELSRMLAGVEESRNALAHAEELLAAAHERAARQTHVEAVDGRDLL